MFGALYGQDAHTLGVIKQLGWTDDKHTLLHSHPRLKSAFIKAQETNARLEQSDSGRQDCLSQDMEVSFV